MLRFAYSLTLYITYPLWSAWMRRRAAKRNEQPNWNERFGNYPNLPSKTGKRAWFHAVSVGEVVAAKPIIEQYRRLNPDVAIVLSTTTSSGHNMAKQLGISDHLIYFPVDLPHVCRRAMRQVNPDFVLILETELWFNFLFFAKRQGAKLALLNGRISDKSYVDATRAAWLYRAMFKLFDKCLMQTEADARRANFFGAKALVVGNSKYDELIGAEHSRDWRKEIGIGESEPLLVIGSTRTEEEEALVLEAISELKIRTLFAPRHVERADAIVQAAQLRGLSVGRYSRGELQSDLLILDEFGLLASTYSQANVAIIGGGFADLGGQNIIQPMQAGCPVICGPHMHNFKEPFEEGTRSGAIVVAKTSSDIVSIVSEITEDSKKRAEMSSAARAVVEQHAGSAKKQAEEISTW